jgi:phosphoglycolate phosphatase
MKLIWTAGQRLSCWAVPRTLLLFDVDGTLLLSGGAGMRAMAAVTADLFGEQFTWDGVEAAGGLDPLLFAEALRNNRIAHDPLDEPRFREKYLARLPRELEANRGKVRAMPGIHRLLAMLHERAQREGDVVLGLLTGNYSLAVPIKLAAIGVDPSWFTIAACGEHAPSRPGLVEHALAAFRQRYGHAIDPQRVIVIGDTPRDVHCAKTHGCFAFAVATSRYSVQTLRDAGADLAVADLSDPSPLLALLDGERPVQGR